MLFSDFLRALDQEVPLAGAGYNRDAIGLQVGLPAGIELSAALFAYEVTDEVIAEASKRGANLIVAFHPLIFPAVDSVTETTRTGTLIRTLVKRDIALYILHTAFDTHPEFGTSRLMAEGLKLANVRPLKPEPRIAPFRNIEGNPGMGAIGTLPIVPTREDFLRITASVFRTPFLRMNNRSPERIETVALLGGAGMDYYSSAISEKADAFITADIRYHDFYRADHDRILLIDAGHAETERFVSQGMVRAARKALANLTAQNSVEPWEKILLVARSEPNAVHYHAADQGTNRIIQTTT